MRALAGERVSLSPRRPPLSSDVRRENIAIIMRDIKRDETREIPYVNIRADLLFQKYPTRNSAVPSYTTFKLQSP